MKPFLKTQEGAGILQISISKIILAKEKQVTFLQTEIAQISIEEQLTILRIQQKI